MLTTELLGRSLGVDTAFAFAQGHTTRLLHALQPAPQVRYLGDPTAISEIAAGSRDAQGVGGAQSAVWVAHRAGVNAIAVEKFEGRYVISGGATGAISMWDLDAASDGSAETSSREVVNTPTGTVEKGTGGHKFGITALTFYPFDSLAFLSSSYDHFLKIFDSTTMSASASFDLSSVVYSHAISPIASHLLVACATQHPAVRLVDLRSGAATQALVGHTSGSVHSVAWSPMDEHILASGGSDGTVRLWDVRKGSSGLGVLDMEDSIGIAGDDRLGTIARRRMRGKAHNGLVNGLLWTADGKTLVSAGQDERIRVWDMAVGANTLANFGPLIRNANASTLSMTAAPRPYLRTGSDILFYPNGGEILTYEMFEGQLLKRSKVVPLRNDDSQSSKNTLSAKTRTTALAWRPHNVELLSTHADGTIRSWLPRTSTDAFAVDSEDDQGTTEGRTRPGGKKRKRQSIREIHRELTEQRVTFT